jgi:hypothetical protein
MSDQTTRALREPLPLFDDIVRRSNLPVNTRHRWLKEPLPRTFRWLLHNPEAALALALEAERLAENRKIVA